MILAIDPGRYCGFAVGLPGRDSGVHRSTVWDLGPAPNSRGTHLRQHIVAWVRTFGVKVIAVELAGIGGKFPQAAMRLNELAGVAKEVAGSTGCEFWEWPIGTWKKHSLGSGRAKKPDVIRLLRLLYGIEVADENEADAIGILKASQAGAPPVSARKRERQLRKTLAARQPLLFGRRKRV